MKYWGPDSMAFDTKGWTKDELKVWINGLGGITRANIECGAVDPQEVWESMKAEKGW